MRIVLKNLLLAIFICVAQQLQAQFYFLENAQDKLEVEFLRKKVETVAEKTFFNALCIKNPTAQRLSFMVSFSIPDGWTFMGEKRQQYTVEPHDSIIVPFRAAAAINSKGEIGYSIVASLSDAKGNTFKNIYNFVNVPKVQDVKFQTDGRTFYIDQQKRNTEVRLKFLNNGNTDELFYLDCNLSKGLYTQGNYTGIYRKEFTLKSHRDTVIVLPLFSEVSPYDDAQKNHRVQIKASTIDTTMTTSVWARELRPTYYNTIPSTYTMLGVELIGRDLVGNGKPGLGANIYGNLLLKGGHDFSMRTLFSRIYTDDWNRTFKYGRLELIYNNRYGTNIRLGDIQLEMAHDLYGRGVAAKQRIGKFFVEGIAEKSVYSDKNSYGAAIGRSGSNWEIILGGSAIDDKDLGSNSIGGFMSNTIRNKKVGTINLRLAATDTKNDNQLLGNRTGMGIQAYTSNRIGLTNYYVNLRYGQPKFAGRYSGRMELLSQVQQSLRNSDYILLNYNRTSNIQEYFTADSVLPQSKTTYDEVKAVYNRQIFQGGLLSGGLVTEGNYGENFSNLYKDIDFSTRNALLYGAIKVKGAKQEIIAASLKSGINFATKYDAMFDTLTVNKKWFSLLLTASYRAKIAGMFFNYYHGPNSLQQHFSHFARKGNTRVVRANPYVDFYIIPRYLRVVNRSTLSYDIENKVTRINLGTDLIVYPAKTWEFSITHTWNFSSTYDVVTEDRYKYQGAYVEAKLKKDFNIDQPRYQYHDLDVVFFKDINGNGIKDADEPGIKDVLFSIVRDDIQDDNSDAASYFMPIELLSDMDGKVVYDNLPNGYYIIEYVPIGIVEGAFTSETSRQNIFVTKNTKLQIPFRENNKIFGSIVLNRSKLSNLGNVSVANIKVTAEDSRGKIYSTLTDQQGNYTLYVPNVDKYTVKINNIFYENFDLEQNNFEVQLNGYRQFEINFIFNEKRRKINFAQVQEFGIGDMDGALEIFRRTNLHGIIKDATTLTPIEANIRVLDSDGKEITTGVSNKKTGLYNLEFLAGENYTIEISAPGYWFYSEKLYSMQETTFSEDVRDVMLKQIVEGANIPMETLTFEKYSTSMRSASNPEMERLLKVLRQNPTVRVMVYGHADDDEVREGGTDYAEERAKMVARYLILNGYRSVKYKGFSNTRPIADSETEDGKSQNRRCEIVVVGK